MFPYIQRCEAELRSCEQSIQKAFRRIPCIVINTYTRIQGECGRLISEAHLLPVLWCNGRCGEADLRASWSECQEPPLKPESEPVSLPHRCNDSGSTSTPPAEKLSVVRFFSSSSGFLLKTVHKQQFTIQNGDALLSALNAVAN